VVALALVGCAAGDGDPIHAWTLDIADGPHDLAVTLPSGPFRKLPGHEVDYTLRARVPLSAAQRGQPLTLELECYHGPLAVTVGGVVLDDIGDTGVGEHRFVIPPALTDVDAIAIAATAHHDAAESGVFGFSAVPRLATGTHVARSAAAGFNRTIMIIAGAIDVIFGGLWAILFVLDRRNRAFAAFAIANFGTLGWALWGLGLVPAWSLAFSLAVFLVSFVYFIHFNFELGRPPRWVFVAATIWATRSLVVVSLSLNVLLLPQAACGLIVGVYIVWRLLQQGRAGEKRGDARLLLGAWVFSFISVLPEIGSVVTGRLVLAGWHIEYTASIAWVLALLVVLGRQQVAREHSLEGAMSELQRQVAERSRALADALAELAKQPRPLDDARMIDERYRVVRRIGAGGMGSVYEVERVADGQHLALKTLRRRADPDAMARFAREAQIAAELRHPNLLSVLDIGVADGTLYLVMPLVDGGSLEQARAKFGDATWALPLVAQIATGLAAMHDRGIVHRDLKPANVLVANGVVKIADFGLAAFGSSVGNDTALSLDGAYASTGRIVGPLTHAGAIFGTPSYMAPELAGGVRDVQPPSDVFAFGMLAHEMIFGCSAFAEPPLVARLAGRAITPTLMKGVEPMLARCLDLDPKKRPSASEVVAAFE
jgi:hypothetical protein